MIYILAVHKTCHEYGATKSPNTRVCGAQLKPYKNLLKSNRKINER